jgi:hypothetical protein
MKGAIYMAKDMKPDVVPKAEVAAEFDAKEIAANAPRLFGYSVDLAAAALEFNRIERCTLEQAQKAIKGFAERKVN